MLLTALAVAWPQRLVAAPADDALPTVTDEPEPPPDGDAVKDDADLDRAMRAFESGSEHYNRAKYKEALNDFLEAASLYASPDFQYNIGLCYEKLDKPEEAIRAFEIYLKTKRDIPDRANVEDRIDRLRAVVEQREKDAKNPKPDKPDRPLDDGSKARRQAKALIGAGAALTAVGAAVALGGGIGLGVAAKKKSDALDDVQSGGNPDGLSFAQAQALEKDGKKLEVGQIAVVAVGAAVGLVGIALLAVGAQRMSKAKRAPKAAFGPSFGGRAFGLSLSGKF
ncbi:MAG TPA: hypothetical protein VG755_16300 [Nannocystaceae bacterium]|nr:hypothetical protein [Nannocystaceae bacterium]